MAAGTRKRLTNADRRATIVQAARVFLTSGLSARMRRRAVLQVPQRRVQLILLGAHDGIDPGSLADAVDVAVVQVIQAAGQPVVALADEHELEDAGELVQVLADVVEAHDLGRFGEHRMPFRAQLPQPC